MSTFHHVLFATDLSPINHDMRDRVSELASELKARLSVVHVLNSFSRISKNYSLVVGLQETLENEARAALNDFCQPLQVPDNDQIIKIGPPVEQIQKTISEENVDLLILGRYGESGIGHLIGSVTHRLINKVRCEVLLIG